MPLIITELDSATAPAGDLFAATFDHPIPDFPRHFVAFQHAPDGTRRVVSYVHYTAWEDHSWLCGGLCVDPTAYTNAGKDEVEVWKRAGGLGEILLRDTLARLTDRPVIFGYCGDARQWQHDLNVGFVPAGPAHLLVIWNRTLPPAEQQRLIAKAAALGAF